MLYIGHGKDNIWLAMALEEFFAEEVLYRDKHSTTALSSLSRKHY
jgi:hypothetical protein